MKALAQSAALLEAQGKGVEEQKMEIRYSCSLPLTTRSHTAGPLTSESGTGVNEQEVEAVGEHSGGFRPNVRGGKTSLARLSRRRRVEGEDLRS